MPLSRSFLVSASVGSTLVAILALHAQTVHAQQTQATGTSGTALDEIIVTAQKREQRLSDVGATIDVATGSELRTLGVTDVSQLASVVPGFTYAVSQVGADTVITMAGSPGTNEVILVGVQTTSLSTTSIFD